MLQGEDARWGRWNRDRERKVRSMVASAMTAETLSAIAYSQKRERMLPAALQVDRAAFAPAYGHHKEFNTWQP
jgi:hypothetical protein